MASPGMWESPTRLYTDKHYSDPQAKLVAEDSPSAGFVLVGESGEIPLELAERFGLLNPASDPENVSADAAITPPTDPETAPSPDRSGSPSEDEKDGPPVTKARQPIADKAVKPAEDK